MKLVFLADAPYVHTRRWVDHFVARGDQCDVISFRPAEIAGARVHYVDGAERLGKGRYLIHAPRVRQLVRDLTPDVLQALHLTSYGFLGALAGFRPYVVSVWGTDVLEAPRLTPFHAWLTRYALARADAVTATGLHLATETTRYTPPGTPVTVVPYGVDLTRFAPPPTSADAREGRSDATVVIGTASRLSPEKGIIYLIDAFALLRQRFGDRVRMRIAGDGPERARIEALLKRHGVADACELLGEIDHAAVPTFLHTLDVFVMPSVFEGFGVAAVEASAAGLPIVASNVYGIPDVVRDGVSGSLVPSKDAAALADAIARLVEDPALRAAYGAAGRTFIAGRYDWQANVAQMERLYDNVLRSARAKVPA